MKNIKTSRQANASYRTVKHKIDANVSVYEFEENGLHVIYSPSLDLYGYGKTVKQAEKSLDVSLNDFINYTSVKNTIFNELKKLGWSMRKSKTRPSIKPPSMEHLMEESDLSRILQLPSYRKTSRELAIAI